jgi:hypothetical protein
VVKGDCEWFNLNKKDEKIVRMSENGQNISENG